MELFHSYHRSKMYRVMHSDFWLFEFSLWLHMFSRSMIAIFIPIFLLDAGYCLGEVMLFYLFFYIFDVPLNFVAKRLITKIGARNVIIWSLVCFMIFYFCLYSLGAGNWFLLLLIAFLAACYDALYWVPHFFLFMRCSKNDDNVGRDTSITGIVIQVAGMLAPAFGAIILIIFSKKVLIVVSMFALFFSIYPLLKIKNLKDKPKMLERQLSFWQFFKKYHDIKDYLSLLLYSIPRTVEAIIFPIFVYILFSSIESVAALPIIVSITTLAFVYFVGGTAKKRRNYLIASGAVLMAIIWLLRIIITNEIFIYASVFLLGFFAVIVWLPLESNLYEKGEKKDILSAATYINTAYMLPNIVLFAVLAMLTNVFEVSFFVTAICLIVLMLLNSVYRLKPMKRFGI
ncbi:MFS transporter [Patescibacteria group bacterium]